MDGSNTSTPYPKARRMRRVTIVRGGHAWVFVCAPGEEAQLLREAGESLATADVPRRRLHLAILARQLGLSSRSLKTGVRKAE